MLFIYMLCVLFIICCAIQGGYNYYIWACETSEYILIMSIHNGRFSKLKWLNATYYSLIECNLCMLRLILNFNNILFLSLWIFLGLGKTFIAAVVMYNYYRWFPQGKIVFMAPTRPLVAQQIRACHDIMAIPIKDTVEMTGKICLFPIQLCLNLLIVVVVTF